MTFGLQNCLINFLCIKISTFTENFIYFLTLIDGVLNNDETQDRVANDYFGISPELVDNLKELYDKLVERYGEVKIILSSTWKHRWYKTKKERQDEFADRLDEALAAVGLEISGKIGES